MEISKHINLIQNHSYQGKIGILKADAGMFHKKGDVVLFRPSEYDSITCAIESPYSEKDIRERKDGNRLINVFATCVGVPLSLVEEIILK